MKSFSFHEACRAEKPSFFRQSSKMKSFSFHEAGKAEKQSFFLTLQRK